MFWRYTAWGTSCHGRSSCCFCRNGLVVNDMTIAFGSYADNSGTFANSFDVSIPVGTRGVIVLVPVSGDPVSGVTIGGQPTVEFEASPITAFVTRSSAWLLSSAVPTGTQTIAISGPASVLAAVITLTAAADVEEADSASLGATVANPSVLLESGGREIFCAVCGETEVGPGSVSPLTDWTSRLEFDAGSATEIVYTYDVVDTDDVTAGWTAASADTRLIAVAIAEVAQIAGGIFVTH